MRLGGFRDNRPPRIEDLDGPGKPRGGGLLPALSSAALHHSGYNYGYSFQTIELRDSGAA